MNRFILLLVFALLANSIFSQKKTARIDSLNLKSEILYTTDVKKSIELSSKALRLSKSIDYQSGEAFACMNLAIANDIQGKAKVAITYFQRAIYLFQKENDLENLSYCYSQLGICYFSQYQYENADYYHQKAIDLCKELHLEEDLANALVNQGITFSYQNKTKEAEANFKQAIELYKKTDQLDGLGGAYNSLGKIYHDQKDYKKAIAYFERASANFKEYDNDYNLESAYLGLANCYFDLKQFSIAKEYSLKALHLSRKIGAKEREVFAHEILSRIYFAEGDYKKAYQSLNKYTILSDAIFTENKSIALAEMQARFEVKEIKFKQRIQAENHFWQMITLVAIIFVVLLVSVLLFFLFRNKKRINVLLEQKVEMTQASLEQKESMMGEIHHRVKNNLQMIYAILDLQARDLKDPESIQLIEDSLNRINAISTIHQKLYQSDNMHAVHIRSYLDELVQDVIRHFATDQKKEIELHSEYDEVSLDIETALPIGLIVAELITNSCKYAFGKQDYPKFYISLKEKDNQLVLTVSDNGVGKTNPGSGTNFGTKLIQSMARKLKANLVETDSDQGLKVELFISNYKLRS
ncbi:tetratricopeptide repeat protein [Fluviicola taffensis]|uniref:tetratricopeptide repeat-containing sensor histidine kinase n=1 Tax=Fluviicola taffensis TaxID=191579 RepID=UPI0031382119